RAISGRNGPRVTDTPLSLIPPACTRQDSVIPRVVLRCRENRDTRPDCAVATVRLSAFFHGNLAQFARPAGARRHIFLISLVSRFARGSSPHRPNFPGRRGRYFRCLPPLEGPKCPRRSTG